MNKLMKAFKMVLMVLFYAGLFFSTEIYSQSNTTRFSNDERGLSRLSPDNAKVVCNH